MVRKEEMAEPSLAARREARRLGIAMAAMMPIIATTIRSSINEKPAWRLVVIRVWCSLKDIGGFHRFLAPPAYRSLFEPRRARSVALGFYNQCATAVFGSNGKKEIVF